MNSILLAAIIAVTPAAAANQSKILPAQWGGAPYCGVGCQVYCAGGYNWRGQCKSWACHCRRNNGRWFR